MNNLFLASQNLMKASLGIMFLFLFFVLSAVIVIGIKALSFYLKDKFFTKPAPPPQPVKSVKKRKPIKSIEISPDENTRIVFKKPS